ncbi:MAG: SirB2 family protein [Burkholderiales bacterium]
MTETWWTLRTLHLGAVVASLALFFLRGLWMMALPEKLQRRWVRVVPHLVDTVLLASAIGLAWLTAQYPWQQPWLAAKIVALVAYVVLGSVALKRGRTLRVRAIAFVAALGTFGYIVAVAATRSVTPWS